MAEPSPGRGTPSESRKGERLAAIFCPRMAFDVDHVGAVVRVAMTSDDAWGAGATLFAVSTDGRRLAVTGETMGAGGQRRGIAAIWKRYSGLPLPDDPDVRRRALESYRVRRRDVEDAINQLLGRDPEMHRPPRLSWDPLIDLLAEHGTAVTEEELIAMPFVFEFLTGSVSALEAG
jgi:hypothetical protein